MKLMLVGISLHYLPFAFATLDTMYGSHSANNYDLEDHHCTYHRPQLVMYLPQQVTLTQGLMGPRRDY